ncbi:hypothetical protein SY85_20455 [Flavisolibacter tropicus]|uniref:TonB-dependent receptor n=1 Tax=Flavisolibacter tropicus TaxID=1492898 RepID=A0A172U2R7_9BACT|nr:hypothetical protein SY85_20455 [Flavisolibacter tropicus]
MSLGLLLPAFLWAQQDTSFTQEKNLDEVIIYSNKFAERKKNIVQKIDVISARQIAIQNTQNTGDLLISTGNVFVQKSQQGGSSPVIRGFEASRVLLVVDGIRMNNAIYRAGHLQNVITVDQNMLEQLEVLYGPASTLYGSDALGGVVHMRTKMPKLSTTGKTLWTGSGFLRYSSANHEKTGHIDLSIGGRKWAWLQAYNYSDFDDMRMGDNYTDKYPNYGRRSQYIETSNGVDRIVTNEDDRIQKFSGYQQWDMTQKLIYKPSEKVSHLLNLQLSNSSNIPRYDRLQDVRNGALRYAEWYYGPQERALAAYELNINKLGTFDNFRTILSYQHIEESRHQRDYTRYDRLDNRLEDLGVISATIDARKLWKQHELTVGVDAQLNGLQSTAFRKNTQTGAVSKLDSRYPNGDNSMNYYGMYGQHTYKFGNGKWVLNDGLRIQAVTLHSTIADNSFFNFPFTTIDQDNLALTGNLGLIHMPSNRTRLTVGLSSGFRAPNIDDAARIFESSNSQLIVPNPDLKPEYTYNADLGFSHSITKELRLEATGFYTLFRNAIALAPYQVNGEESTFYNGNTVKGLANQNVNKAYLYGVNATITANISQRLSAYGTINYTYGRYKTDESKLSNVFLKRSNGSYIDSTAYVSSRPLDHIPPFYGKVSLRYAYNWLTLDAYTLFNGWKRVKDMIVEGEDNPQYAAPNGYVSKQVIPEGYPAWYTLNLKASATVTKNLTIQAGIENMLDRNYRPFASGFSAPGRNILIAVRSSF